MTYSNHKDGGMGASATPDKATQPSVSKSLTAYRERASNGQFSYQGQWERPCVCGHPLGEHTAAAPHDCMAEDTSTGLECYCERFKPMSGLDKLTTVSDLELKDD